jgi:hypothetical protein
VAADPDHRRAKDVRLVGHRILYLLDTYSQQQNAGSLMASPY